MIYLDYNASTPLDPAVREAMLPFLGAQFGNPSSNHAVGQVVREAVENARGQVATLLGAEPDEIVFTSGGTEASNLVIKGVARKLRERGRHIITSAIEHPAVVNPCRFLEGEGFEVSYVGVDGAGQIDPQAILDEVRADTILISIMHANNEVGTLQPIQDIAEIAREGGVWMHTDAAQSCGKISTRVDELGVEFLSLAGHKLYAPQGIGALYIRRGVSIEPLHHGAGHERGRRAGTEPVAAIVGLGAAAQIAVQDLSKRKIREENGRSMVPDPRRESVETELRDLLHRLLDQELGDRAVLLGHPTKRLPNTLSLGFRGRIGSEVLAACPEVCASTGAACHSGRRERSATLAAMDVPDEVAFGAIRFSVGRFSTHREMEQAAELVLRALGDGR